MHSDTVEYSQTVTPPETRSNVPGPRFVKRFSGANRAQRRKLAALRRVGDVDGVSALLNVIVHRFGLAGNGERSRLVRSVNARRRIK